MSGKYALIIGNTEYSDPSLAQLSAPGRDAEDFARVLQSKDICGFDDVKVSLNQPSTSVIEAIDEFFDQKKPDDMLVLYFSGHGVKDESGSLYLAFKNTVRSRLRSTAIKSDYIREAMDQSRSKRQVLILDCCNSGAFPQGTKAETGGTMGMTQAFQGYGRFVLTASDSTQFAWEGDKVIGETDNSLFTHFLVKGLEGEADSDGDGRITVDELYDYAYGQVSKVTPKQTPTKSSSKQEGEIVLRQNMRIEDIKPVPLPTPLLDSIENPFSDVRLGAVQQLTKLLNGKNLGLARSAKEALERVAEDDDSRQVSRAAFQALETIRQADLTEKRNENEERKRREENEAERIKKQKVDVQRLLNERATEAERQEKAARIAVQKAEEERIAKAKIEAKHLAEEKRLAIEKAESDKKAQDEAAERTAIRLKAEQEAVYETAERKATEKARAIPGKKANPQLPSRRQRILKRAIIGITGLFVITTGVWTISYSGNLGVTTREPIKLPAVTETVFPQGSDLSSFNVLVAAAKEEGMLTTIALPHDWCNYGGVIEAFKAKYPDITVNELNPDAGSGDEIEAIKANKDNKGPQAPDVIDLGYSFGESSKAEGLIQPYKVSTWDSIPDDAKDAEGYWYGDYYGVLSFLVNTDVQPNVPQDWADLLDPKYNGQVALSGDPRTSNQAIQSVFAATLANGGSLNDAQAGLDFFADLNATGNLIPLISNNGLVATGETAVRITWDYNALAAVDSFEGNPTAEVVIPAAGRFAGVYVQAISAYAPHPNAAKLWMEFLYSDEGQLLWMEGYCHPIREADLRARNVIPAELLAKLPDVSGAVFPTLDQLNAAKALITENWDSYVGANIQSSP